MNRKEFIANIKIVEKQHMIYSIGCKDCVSYSSGQNYQALINGLMDGKEQEFYKIADAKAAIKLHKSNNPLHKPYINDIEKEYVIRQDEHMLRYRSDRNGRVFRVYSVDGFKIASDKCAYACKQCGAIWESKGLGHSLFTTDDPRCTDETHTISDLVKLCICEDIGERYDKEFHFTCHNCSRNSKGHNNGWSFDKNGFPLCKRCSTDISNNNEKKVDQR